MRKKRKTFIFSEAIYGENGESQVEQAFKKLGKSFRQLSSLKVLKFKSNSGFGDEKLEFLSRGWKHLSGIETLDIQYQFTRFKITNYNELIL